MNYFGKSEFQIDDPLGDIGFRFKTGARVQAECTQKGKNIIGDPECRAYTIYRSSFQKLPIGTKVFRSDELSTESRVKSGSSQIVAQDVKGDTFPEGTFEADFSSSGDNNVVAAGDAMELSITFSGAVAWMNISALGQTEKHALEATYVEPRVFVWNKNNNAEKGDGMVLRIEDENTLRCELCPDGMPRIWRKQSYRKK